MHVGYSFHFQLVPVGEMIKGHMCLDVACIAYIEGRSADVVFEMPYTTLSGYGFHPVSRNFQNMARHTGLASNLSRKLTVAFTTVL